MKLLRKIVIISFLLQTLTLLGNVSFEFVYADEPGTGFHAKPKAQAVLKQLGEEIGGEWLKNHNALIKIKVVSKKDKSRGACIAMTQEYDNKEKYKRNLINFDYSSIQRKIILGEKQSPREFDGVIEVNFAHKFSYGDHVHSDRLDFKEVMLHEITHLLGIASNAQTYLEFNGAHLRNNVNNFIKELFVYSINEIEGVPQSFSLDSLKEDLIFFKNSHIDIRDNISELLSLPKEIRDLKEDLFLEFKKNMLEESFKPIKSSSFNELNDYLTGKQITFREFIEFDYNVERLVAEMLLLGVKKLSDNPKLPCNIDEAILRKNFTVFYRLHKDDNYYLTCLKKFIAKKYREEKDYAQISEIIIEFVAEYLISEDISHEEIIRVSSNVDNLLKPFGISLETFSLLVLDCLNIDNLDLSYFDQFISYKHKKEFFKTDMDAIKSHSSFLHRRKGKDLFFYGPKTLKHVGSPTNLTADGSHIAMKKISVMNSVLEFGVCFAHEWDKRTTAMLLDLGYKVDNYWTRRWYRHVRDREKEHGFNKVERKVKAKRKAAEKKMKRGFKKFEKR